MVGDRAGILQSSFLLAISSRILTFSFQLNYVEGLHADSETFLPAHMRLKGSSA